MDPNKALEAALKARGLLKDDEEETTEENDFVVTTKNGKRFMVTISEIKEEVVEQKIKTLESKMDALLSALFDYANDGNAGPGSPLLPARDVELRKIIAKIDRGN